MVGIGSKDGTYYVLDRDGVNQITGMIEPYWQRNVVPGGAAGGIIASGAVAGDRVLFSTAFGDDSNDQNNYQKPAAWGLDAGSGNVVWSNPNALASFSPTFAVPGIIFMGSFAGYVYAFDANTGEQLAQVNAFGPLYSQAVVVDGQLYVGAGSGAHESGPEDVSYVVSEIPSPLSAFCVEGTDGCPASGVCIDGNPCSADEMNSDGSCHNPNLADGTACRVGAFSGQCSRGICQLADRDCDDNNQCTQDTLAGSRCSYRSEPKGTPCTARGVAGQCNNGACIVPQG